MIQVTPMLDASPCPRAEVYVSSMPAGTATVTIHRTADGTSRVVRGAVGAVTAGALSRMDHEVPFGVPVVYQAEYVDAAGATIGYESSAPVVLDVAETWLHNPLHPQGAVAAAAMATAAQTLSRPATVTFSRPLGGRFAVALSEPRGGLDGLNFDVRADDADTAAKVQALLGTAGRHMPPVICIRVGSRDALMRVPRPLYLGVANILEVDVSVMAGLGMTRQEMSGMEANPPVPGLAVPLLTNADLNAMFATNAAIKAAHASNADVNRRYDLAGAGAGGRMYGPNLCPNPSFELNTAGWTSSGLGSGGAGASFTRSTDWAADGVASARAVNASGGSFGDIRAADAMPWGIMPDRRYRFEATIHLPAAHSSPTTANRQRRLFVAWRIGGGAWVETHGPQAPNVPGTHRLSVEFTLPAGVTNVVLAVGTGGSATDPLFTTYVDAVSLNEVYSIGGG